MHFNVYIDDTVGVELARLAKREKRTRNALIRQALKEWLLQHAEKAAWPESVLAFKGVKAFPAFESHRKKLKLPKDDPLA